MEQNNQEKTQGQKTKIWTPEYWKEEKYQPLVEVKTAFGTPVQIPKNLLHTWRACEMMKDGILPILEQVKANGFFKKKPGRQKAQDLKTVYFEQEPPND